MGVLMKSDINTGRTTIRRMGLNIFARDDIETIHQATLDVMRAGIRVESDEARQIFDGGGCTIYTEQQLVKFSPQIVEEAISAAPSQFLCAGRNPQNDIIVGDKRVVFSPTSGATKVIDPYTGKHRDSTKKDVGDFVKVIDAMSEAGIANRPCVAQDVPNQEACVLHEVETALHNTTKHLVCGSGNRIVVKKLVEMAAAVTGGKVALRDRPLITSVATTTSPLALSETCCDTIIEFANAGLPSLIACLMMGGGTGPVTLAGLAIAQNAEILSGIVLAQLVCKGAPVFYYSASSIFDLRKGTIPLGSPQHALLSAAAGNLAQYYKIPSYGGGMWSDSKVPDAQAALEAMQGLLLSLSGSNVITGMGVLNGILLYSLDKLVVDNEIAKMIKDVMRGIEINDETMAVDLIKKLGPRGDYLSAEHTLRHMKEPTFLKLIDHSTFQEWDTLGAKDMTQRAHEEVLSILENYTPEPLPQDVMDTLNSIVKIGEEELVAKQ
jgi:trimethylamine--corrinoid protein Co-methyltransferase